jgi:DtxR family Mn-dependent transcriptional regulator
MEDYLEAIALLKKNKKVARVKDISSLMNVTTPSVTAALSFLCQEGLVEHERYGYVDLTPEGERLAQRVLKRHDTLIKFFIDILKINPDIAQHDACKIEHSISSESFAKLTKFIEFIETYSQGKRLDWFKKFDYYFGAAKRAPNMNKAIQKVIKQL